MKLDLKKNKRMLIEGKSGYSTELISLLSISRLTNTIRLSVSTEGKPQLPFQQNNSMGAAILFNSNKL